MSFMSYVLLVSLTLHHQHTKAIKKNIQTSGHPCCNHRPSNDASQRHPPPAAPPPQLIKQSNSHSPPHTICQQWLLFLHHYDSNSNIWPLVLVAITASTASHHQPLKQLRQSNSPPSSHSTTISAQHHQHTQAIKKNTWFLSSLLQSPAMHPPSTTPHQHPAPTQMIKQSNTHHSHSTQAHLSMMTIPAST